MKLDRWWAQVADGRRVDRGPMYASVMVAIFFVSLSMSIIGPVPDSAISEIPTLLQDWLAVLMLLGSAIAVTGSLLGSRYFFPNADRITTYTFGIVGTPAIVASLAYYSWAVIHGTPTFSSALGGMLAPMLCIGTAVNAGFFWLEIRRIKRNIPKARGEVEQEVRDGQSDA